MPNIAELIDYGQIKVGMMEPVGCVVVASEEENTLAKVRRRKGETLLQLPTRLDQAIDKSATLGIFTDEINREPSSEVSASLPGGHLQHSCQPGPHQTSTHQRNPHP